MVTQWFIKPTGKNSEMVKIMVMAELADRNMCADPQYIIDTKGEKHWAYEVATDMLTYMKNCRVSRGINFRVFKRELGSNGSVTEDKFIYASNKKRPSKKVQAAMEAAEKIKKSKQ